MHITVAFSLVPEEKDFCKMMDDLTSDKTISLAKQFETVELKTLRINDAMHRVDINIVCFQNQDQKIKSKLQNTEKNLT